jgi:hypothetical protein
MGRPAQKGEFDMLYAVRKRRGRWTVCSDETVVLQFETYDEAVATVRGAVAVLAQRSRLYDVPLPRHAADGARDDGAQNTATASGS